VQGSLRARLCGVVQVGGVRLLDLVDIPLILVEKSRSKRMATDGPLCDSGERGDKARP
jgi:hypothetical protein